MFLRLFVFLVIINGGDRNLSVVIFIWFDLIDLEGCYITVDIALKTYGLRIKSGCTNWES